MSKAYIDESSLTSIGNAIRSVNGSSSLYTPSQMANEILTLTSGGLTYKGTVSSQSQLPSDPSDGDLYIVGNQTMFWSDTDNEWKTISVQSSGGISTVKVNGTPLVEDSQGAVDVVIPSWSMQQSKPSYTASEVGAVATSSVGAASGVASLGSDGKVPSSQLPSFEAGISAVKVNGVALEEDSQGAVDVLIPTWAMEQSKPSYTASEVGAVSTGDVGAASGVASLGSDGKVPSSQLPDMPSGADWSVTSSAQDGYIANKPFQTLDESQFTQVARKLKINVGSLADSNGGLYEYRGKLGVIVDGTSVVIDGNGALKATGVPEAVSPLEVNQEGQIELNANSLVGNGLNVEDDSIVVNPSDFVDGVTLGVNNSGYIYVLTSGLVDGTTIDTDGNGKLIVSPVYLCDGETIVTDSNTGHLKVNLNGSSISATSSGLEVNVDGSTIDIDNGGSLCVDLDSIVSNSYVLINAGGMLYFNYDSDSGLDASSENGLFIKTDDETIKSSSGGLHVDTSELCDESTIYAQSDGGKLSVNLSRGLETSTRGGISVKTDDTYSNYEGGLGIDQNTNCLYVRRDMFLPDSTVANVEESTASMAYSVGEYLMQGGTLKRVTSAISYGDTIVNGTNVVATTIMEEIARLTQ